jgi:hypothetical protein
VAIGGLTQVADWSAGEDSKRPTPNASGEDNFLFFFFCGGGEEEGGEAQA